MRIAIVDDQAADRSELTALLERYCAQRKLQAQWDCFSSGEALLEAFAPGRYSLVFLDIYMGALTGMETARRLTAMDELCRVVFVTVSHSHAVESYEVRAAYYLTKPLEYHRFSQAMDAACGELLRQSRCLPVHSAGVALEIPLQELLYVDCSAERTRLHLAERLLLIDERFSAVSAQLAEVGCFLNCNRNVAVNMEWIAQVQDGNFLLRSGEAVPIRQRGRSAVKKEFLSYSLRELRRESWG